MENQKKKILAIIGSATPNSSNLKLIEKINEITPNFEIEIFKDLSILPHFNTELTDENTPKEVEEIRMKIENSDGIFFSTPEYIFSIPSRLKNLLEWCVSTNIFSEKPVSTITASASGEKGHDELNLILKTLGANIDEKNSILIKGIKGRFDENGNLNESLLHEINEIVLSFELTIEKHACR